MGSYYRHSALTIAADTAAGDNVGFLHTRRDDSISNIKIPFIRRGSTEGSMYIGRRAPTVLPSRSFPRTISTDPIHSRAWALQEWLLSPRIAHYTSKGVYFECGVSHFGESWLDATETGFQTLRSQRWPVDVRAVFLPFYSHHLRRVTIRSQEEEHKLWYQIVSLYHKRKLTKHQDRLPAIAGLAKEFQRKTGFEYKAGLWLEDIRRGLLWNGRGTGTKVRNSGYIAPSWSWASHFPRERDDVYAHFGDKFSQWKKPSWNSWKSPARNFWTLNTKKGDDDFKKYTSVIHKCDIDLKDHDEYGRLLDGRLVIEGYMGKLTSVQSRTRFRINSPKELFESYVMNRPSSAAPILNFDLAHRALTFQNSQNEIYLLAIDVFEAETHPSFFNENAGWISRIERVLAVLALMLEVQPDGSFRRVGMAEVPLRFDIGRYNFDEEDENQVRRARSMDDLSMSYDMGWIEKWKKQEVTIK